MGSDGPVDGGRVTSGGTSTRATRDWALARQALSALRQPEMWFDHIREVVKLEHDELQRTVLIRVAQKTPIEPFDGEYLLAVQTPRKGNLVDLHLDEETAKRGEILSHDDHSRLTRLMIVFQFRSYLAHALKTSKHPAKLLERSKVTMADLIALVDGPAESRADLATISDLFVDGVLRNYPRGRPGSLLRAELTALYSLCQLAVDRYLRLIRFAVSADKQTSCGYSYSQEQEARWYGAKLTGILRRWFRAPASLLFVHAPLARLTAHYELHLDAVPGYYVHEQFALWSGQDPHQTTGTSANTLPKRSNPDSPWWSTRRGGWASGFIFVGDGYRSSVRLYGAFRLLEMPPGATGRAFAGVWLGFLTLLFVVAWSLLHEGQQSSVAAPLIVALVAFGSAALDNTTAKRELFNAPLLARFVLFCQTLIAITTAAWLLARGTSSTALPPAPGAIAQFAQFVTTFEWFIGVAALIFSSTLVLLITRKAAQAMTAYHQIMRGSLDN